MNVEVVFWSVVLVRFFLPLLIFKFPLPAIFACLVVDGMDQTIFQWFDFNPPFYQSYDKAMDVFYLGIAYISTLRNWASIPSFEVSRFLFFYRQIGVVAFELTQVRAILLVFPNTFEYFFMAYEGIRARWNPVRFGMRFWIGLAAFIWIFIKLPQEYWIHVAQLDFTDTVKDVSWFGPAIVCGILALLAVFWFLVRPRLIAADHPMQLRSTEASLRSGRGVGANGVHGRTRQSVVSRNAGEGIAHWAAERHLRLRPSRPAGSPTSCSSHGSQSLL